MVKQMTGPNGVRDKKGTSDEKSGRSNRRRRSAAAGPKTGGKEGLRQVKRFLWDRKYTLMFLLLMMILSFAVRSVWYYDAAYTGGPTPLLSGNDPDYHKRTVDYFIGNHHFLMRDPLLSYPGGGPNPNPPAYSTSVALVGYALTPFYGGDLNAAVWFSMEIGAALWAALTVLPVYLFTKEMFGRKAAWFAALFIAFMPGNVERTPLGFSDHDAFFMFFIVTGFFFLLKSLRMVKTRVYVKDWRQPRDITVGMNEFARINKVSLLYAGMAGFALAAVALSWKGFPYALAIIFVYLMFHMLVNKFRRIDNTAIGMIILMAVSIMMLVALPYYMAMHFMNWFEAPAILYAGIMLVIAVFLFTRDLPWLLILPVVLLAIVVALSVVWFVLPDVWTNIFSGAGYFIRTKLYGTIAEAQPPDFNRLVFAYGMTTFFLGMIGVVMMLKDLPKGWKNDHIFTTIWALVSMYMAIAAIRFMYNATPVFAILAGWLSWWIIEKLDYRRMMRVFRSMKGDFIKALKYSVKLRHIAGVVFVVFMLFAPNIWHSYDGGVPYEFKKEHDLAIYNAMPSILRPPEDRYDPTSNSLWYLGSFGTSFMSDYWAQGMWWLAEQDTWLPEDKRPAFISWWDYGHWCVNVGKHPTAADNFQNGVEFAGNFIAAEGEQEANALMLVRLFQLNRNVESADQYMRSQLDDIVVDELLDLYIDPGKYTKLIHEYPERYGLKDKDVSNKNTVFIHGTWLVEKATTEEQRVEMLLWYYENLGESFRYFAVDSRLMPVSYQNTGIFYAPIVLSDNRVDDYIEIYAVYQGNQITLDQAATLTAEERANLQYTLVWKRPFYESMFYRTFIGYSGYDQGPDYADAGIPFVSGDLAQSTPLPAWNMTNWQVAHRTIHWNPANASEISKHPRDWEAISYDDAVYYNDNEMGVIDDAIRTISSGVVYIKWYAGAWINGTVRTETGKPVPGATITVHDGYRFLGGYMGPDFKGIPHGTTQTDDEGRFSILAPAGNVTVVASNGGNMDYVNLHEKNMLNSTNIFIPDSAAMRQGEYNFTVDMLVPTSQQEGVLFADSNGDGAYQDDEDMALENATLTVKGQRGLNVTYTLKTAPDGYFQLKDALPGDYLVSMEYEGHSISDVGAIVLSPGEKKEQDVNIPFSSIVGTITRRDGKEVEGTEVTVRNLQTNVTSTAEARTDGAYQFDNLLAGNYSVELFVPGTRPLNESVTIEPGEEFMLNLTLLPVAFIEGQVRRGIDLSEDGSRLAGPGEPMVNVTLTFHMIGGEGLVWTATTNATGHFNTSLPNGRYTVYAHETDGDTHLAAIDVIDVDSEDWSYQLDLDMEPAFLVNGTLQRTASDTNDTLISAGRTVVEIWNDVGRIYLTANSSGVFSIYLPDGDYSFFTYKYIQARPKVHLTFVNVTDAGMDLGVIELTNGTRIEGNVFFDKNGDLSMDADEAISGADLIITGGGHDFNATTALNGSYYMVVAPLNYTVEIDLDAYEPVTSHINASGNVLPTKQNFRLQPYNVTYTGLAGYDVEEDANLSGNGFPGLLIKFEVEDAAHNPNAVAANFTTDAKGNYRLELAPGKYRVKVEHDVTEGGITFRYRHDKVLDVDPSTDEQTFNVWLNKLVKFNGTVSLEGNDTKVYTSLRVDGGSRRIQVSAGKFDDYVPVGEHLLTATYYNYINTSISDRYELEMRYDFDEPTQLDLKMKKVVRFHGVTYYDRNENGVFDAGDPDDADDMGEAVYVFRFTLRGVQDHDGIVRSNGSFDEKFTPYDNYTLLIENTEFSQEDNANYQYYYNGTIDLSHDKQMDIPLERRLLLSGRGYWERDDDVNVGPNERIADLNVTITAADGSVTYTTKTKTDGRYEQWVRVDVEGNGSYVVTAFKDGFEPNQTEWEHKINSTNMTRDLLMKALDINLRGTTFIDQNLNGVKNWYEPVIQVDHIQIWDEFNVSKTYSVTTDANGTFNLSLRPGSYNMFAWTEMDGGYLVHLKTHTLEPGSVHEMDVPMTTGRRMSGIMYFYNYTGANHTVSEVNLTFEQLDGNGIVPVLASSGGSYSAVLPEGRYKVNGTFEEAEFGVDISYKVDQEVRMVLKDRPDADLNFTKVREWKLEITWEDISVWLDENSSYNFTVFARNVGSENGTFDITVTTPTNWLWDAGENNVTLNLSQRTSFWVLVNTSKEVVAAPQKVTVTATPRDGDSAPSKLEVTFNINQHYGFELKANTENQGYYRIEKDKDGNPARQVSYFFTVLNKGNGQEILKLTTSDIQDWTIEIPQKEVVVEAYQEFKSVPIEVTLPEEAVLKSQTLRITATAQNAPSKPSQTLDLTLTFPDLTAKKVNVGGDEGGKPLEFPSDEAPGFGTLTVLAAIVVVALVADRRRRGW